MNFIITRTSDEDRKPCRGAYQDKMNTSYGKEDVYRIKINSLEELMKLIKKYGTIIIGPHFDNEEETHIEIYDDYRE